MRIVSLNDDKQLAITWKEMLACGFSNNTLTSLKYRADKSTALCDEVSVEVFTASKATFLQDPKKKSAVLIIWESLAPDWQEKVIAKYGNPYEHLAIDQIKSMIVHDDKAYHFYSEYKLRTKNLDDQYVRKYTRQAEFLNLLVKLTDDKRELKARLNLTIEQFYIRCCQLIVKERLGLPTSYRRLAINDDSALKKYRREGYASLISWKHGNKLAAKVRDEVSETLLLELIAHNLQFDDVMICAVYNEWATQNNYKTIEPATVGYWRRTREEQIVMEREGNAAHQRKYNRSIKSQRPSEPLSFIESDDNHLDLLFIDPDDSTQHKYYHKQKAIIVSDSFNDLPLGWASAEKLTPELVRAAYMDAMYYVRSLTGHWHLFGEVKTDRWALTELEPFYRQLGKFAETPAGSKNRGYLEQFFGSIFFKRQMKLTALGSNNYSGNNMTAKYRGVNTEVLDRSRKDYPLLSEANNQIAAFVHRLRHTPMKDGLTKEQQWLRAYGEKPSEHKRIINDEQFLMRFGIEHNWRDGGLQITNQGVKPMIRGVRYNYDLAQYRVEDIGKSVTVLYDPNDMSRVLLTDNNGFRMMAFDARFTARAMDDATTEKSVYLRELLNQKREVVEAYSTRSERRKQVLREAGISVEAVLQSGHLGKELRQHAEVRALPGRSDNISDDYLDQI